MISLIHNVINLKIKLFDAAENIPDIRLNWRGLRIAGQSKRKKINPLTTLVLTSLSWGHFAMTVR